MKKKTITTIGTVSIVLAFSGGCSQSKVDDLNAQLKISQEDLSRTQGDLANAKKAQREAEQELMIAQNQAETALAKLAEQQQRPIQNQPETAGGKPSGNPTSKKERFSYAVGLQIGGDFGNKEIKIDFAQFAEGVKTAYLSKDTLMTQGESKKVLDEVWKEYQEREKTKRSAEADVAKKAGNDYLAANRKKPGVKVTASGLQYESSRPAKAHLPRKATRRNATTGAGLSMVKNSTVRTHATRPPHSE